MFTDHTYVTIKQQIMSDTRNWYVLSTLDSTHTVRSSLRRGLILYDFQSVTETDSHVFDVFLCDILHLSIYVIPICFSMIPDYDD